MLPNEPTRTQRRAAAMRRTIVEAAEAIVIEGGPGALTIEEVAKRADVAIQTVYNRVGGRSALLFAIAERTLEEGHKSLKENRKYMDTAYDSDGTPIERITRMGHAYIRFALERPQQFRILVNPPDDPAVLEMMNNLAQEQNAKLATALHDGIKIGSINPLINPDQAATVLRAMMNGVLSTAWRANIRSGNDEEREKLIETALLLIGNGLKNQPLGCICKSE